MEELLTGAIIADPNWDYDRFWSKAHGSHKPHYKGARFEDIAAVPVWRWAAKDCILGLWCTWPKLDQGVDVLREWGFDYVTGFPWVKVLPKQADISTGVGIWSQGASEIFMIGRRGHPRRRKIPPVLGLLTGDRAQPIFYAPRSRKHSEKPVELHAWFEALLPGPYLELYGRVERPNWTVWGLDLGYELGPWGVREVGTKAARVLEARQLSLFAEA